MRLLSLLFFMFMYIHVNAQNELVFPGDFNMDGVVSIHDALYWGLAHGETGPERTNATIDWTAQAADDWDESIRQVNNKFQDGDGNGVIDTFDLAALHQNFDSTHIYIIKDSIDSENDAWLEHYASESGGIRDNRYDLRLKKDTLHGIAFTFDYSEYGDAATDVMVSLEGSPLENNAVVVEVLKEDEYRLHVAVTSTEQTNFITNGDLIVSIFICEDIAALVSPPEVSIWDGAVMRADESLQVLDDYQFQTPPPPVPECKALWTGEQCLYENGIINSEEVEFNYCFEGWMSDGLAGINMGCRNILGESITDFETLSFWIKADEAGMGTSVEFFIMDVYGNSSNAFIVNDLDTAFRKIQFPIEVLENDEPVLETIEWIYFETTGNEDFTIFVDDILLNGWFALWNGEKCWYRDGIISEEEVHNGRYSFERIINEYDWNHSVIGLHCEQNTNVNLSASDEIRFYAKADQMGKTFNFFASEAYQEWFSCNTLNIDDYIEGGELTDDYLLVSIPIDALKNDSCTLEKVQSLHFFNEDDTEFKFYIDDVHVYSEGCTPSTEDSESSDNQQLIIHPNPASEFLSIQFHSRQSARGEARIFDMQGRLIDRLSTQLTAGQNVVTYSSAKLSAGVYVIHIESEHEFYNGKFVIGY